MTRQRFQSQLLRTPPLLAAIKAGGGLQDSRFRLSLLAIAIVASSCVGVSANRIGADGTPDLLRYCATGTTVADDGIIDDFEDGDTRLASTDGRGGYWWKSADTMGSTIGPDDFKPTPSGPNGSMAIHAVGKTTSGGGDENWGAQFGANFKTDGVYDASKYVGMRFKARVSENSTASIRFKIGDENTHPDLGKCKNCWNHFGRALNFTTDWQTYEVLFASLEQAPYWGDPRPAAVNPKGFYSINFAIDPGAKFDIWLDDIEFIVCK